MKLWTSLALLVTLSVTLTPMGAAQGKYSVPAPRAVTAAYDVAQEALKDDDIEAAANAIVKLLDAEAGELIEVNPREWIGARQAARLMIGAPTSALAQAVGKRRESAGQAELRALVNAGARLGTDGLTQLESIAWRHPMTQAQVQANLLAGDLAFESGETNRARTLWQAALDSAVVIQDAGLRQNLIERAQARLALASESTYRQAPAPKGPQVDDMIEGRWAQYLPLGPRDRYIDYGDLRPVAVGRYVWVNTGLRVMCFLAASGQLVWDSNEPAGWDSLSSWKRKELFRGVALPDLTNRVATDGRIVVAPLQLPFTENKNDNIDGLTITVSLPERRLFAYDAQTGAPLWDHAPTPTKRLSGVRLEFPERARIAAPPSIQGDLVIVPSYELVGRINLYVTAYDLYTGALVWNRLVVSGQTRVNLFGEHEAEFNAAPLAIQDGRVLVSSNLGVLSALDLATGHPLWTQEYRRYELPRTNGYYTPNAQRRWHNAAPLIDGERFCIAPIDSPDLLLGLVATGVLARFEGNELEDLASEGQRDRADLDHVVRLSDDGLWIGGDQFAAFLVEWSAERIDITRRWVPLPTPGPNDAYNSPSPRARVLDAGHVFYVPTEYQVLAVEPDSGDSVSLGPLDSDMWQPGNLAIAEGRLLVLTDEYLYGWVNWDAVIDEGRARLANAASLSPDLIATITVDLGRAYLSRWEARGKDVGDLDAARACLMGREVDEWKRAGYLAELELRDLRFGLLNAEAEALELRNEGRKANERLGEALAFAPNINARITVRFRQFEVLGQAKLTESGWRAKERRLILEALLKDHPREVLDADTATEIGADFELDELLGRLDPALAQLSDDLGDELMLHVPLGFLALAAIAEADERGASRPSEYESALSRWHTALWDYGALEAPPGALVNTLGEWVTDRIARVLTTAGGRSGYVAFEAAAEERISKAQSAALPDRVQALSAVVSRYPHSAAAARVNREMIELLVDALTSEPNSKDFARLAELAEGQIQDGADNASHARLAMARGAMAVGNIELAGLFAERLRETDPRLEGVLTQAPIAWPDDASRRAFHGPLQTGQSNASVRLGNYTPVGSLMVAPQAKPGNGQIEEILLAGSSTGELIAFRPGSRGEVIWTLPIGNYANASWPERVLNANAGETQVLCVQADNGVVGVSPTNGSLVWDQMPLDRRPKSIQVEGGLLTVLWIGEGGSYDVQAFSAQDGVLLWSKRLPDVFNDYRGDDGVRLLRAGTRLVVLGREKMNAPIVLDVTSGAELGQLELKPDTTAGDREAAWIDGQMLFVPRILGGTGKRTNVIDGFDLSAPKSAPVYTLPLSLNQELAGIVQSPVGTYLWLINIERKSGQENALVQVNAELGALRRVANLEQDEKPVGLDLGGVLTLDTDFMVTCVPPRGNGLIRLRGISLPLGTLWNTTIPAPGRVGWQLYDGSMPAALASAQSVAVLYAQISNESSRGQEVHLLTLDRQSGRLQEDRVLSSRLGRLSAIELGGAADELYLFGKGGWENSRGRLEVLSPQTDESR